MVVRFVSLLVFSRFFVDLSTNQGPTLVPNPSKFSVHLHAHLDCGPFSSIQGLGDSVRAHLSLLPSDSPRPLVDVARHVDLSVYNSARCCRLLGCLKAGRPASSCLRLLSPEENLYGIPSSWLGSSLTVLEAFRLSVPCRLEGGRHHGSASRAPLAHRSRASSPSPRTLPGSFPPFAPFERTTLGAVARAALARHHGPSLEDDPLSSWVPPNLAPVPPISPQVSRVSRPAAVVLAEGVPFANHTALPIPPAGALPIDLASSGFPSAVNQGEGSAPFFRGPGDTALGVAQVGGVGRPDDTYGARPTCQFASPGPSLENPTLGTPFQEPLPMPGATG